MEKDKAKNAVKTFTSKINGSLKSKTAAKDIQKAVSDFLKDLGATASKLPGK